MLHRGELQAYVFCVKADDCRPGSWHGQDCDSALYVWLWILLSLPCVLLVVGSLCLAMGCDFGHLKQSNGVQVETQNSLGLKSHYVQYLVRTDSSLPSLRADGMEVKRRFSDFDVRGSKWKCLCLLSCSCAGFWFSIMC